MIVESDCLDSHLGFPIHYQYALNGFLLQFPQLYNGPHGVVLKITRVSLLTWLAHNKCSVSSDTGAGRQKRPGPQRVKGHGHLHRVEG